MWQIKRYYIILVLISGSYISVGQVWDRHDDSLNNEYCLLISKLISKSGITATEDGFVFNILFRYNDSSGYRNGMKVSYVLYSGNNEIGSNEINDFDANTLIKYLRFKNRKFDLYVQPYIYQKSCDNRVRFQYNDKVVEKLFDQLYFITSSVDKPTLILPIIQALKMKSEE